MQLSICVAGLACRNYNSSVEGRYTAIFIGFHCARLFTS
jgi:hypothetical protein